MGEKKWYVVYTRPRYEKRVESQLLKREITCYLPLIKSLRQWSDRKKWVEMPLFSSYVFVFTDLANQFDILNTPGAIRFISFEGKPVEIPARQIENIKWILSTDIVSEPLNDKIPQGTRVEIMKGPLRGLRAELITYMSKNKIVLRLDELDKSIEIQIPESHVKQITLNS